MGPFVSEGRATREFYVPSSSVLKLLKLPSLNTGKV
jgi:hypothetical protein